MEPTLVRANPALSDSSASQEKKRRILIRLQRDLGFVFFYLLPELEDFEGSPQWLSGATQLNQSRCKEWSDDLLFAGLWVQNPVTGEISLGSAQWELAASQAGSSPLSVFLSLAAQIQSRLDLDDSKSWYEVKVQSTTPEIFMNFKKKVLAAQGEFVAESDATKSTLLVASSQIFYELPSAGTSKKVEL